MLRFHSPNVRALRAAALGAATLLASGSALASESFPGAIYDYLIATGEYPTCPPTCTLCHKSPSGGRETIRDTGFTDNLRVQSSYAYNIVRMRMPPQQLLSGDASTVGPALAALEKLPCQSPSPVMTPCDSDNDGVSDVAELRKGDNPDGPGKLSECPQYGCGASVAPVAARPAETHGAWLVAALGALVFVRRQRR